MKKFIQDVAEPIIPIAFISLLLVGAIMKAFGYIQQSDYNLYYAENQAFGKFGDFKSE